MRSTIITFNNFLAVIPEQYNQPHGMHTYQFITATNTSDAIQTFHSIKSGIAIIFIVPNIDKLHRSHLLYHLWTTSRFSDLTDTYYP